MTEACNRFEREALQLLEEGRPLPPHFATCPDCQQARQSYERLTKLLSAPGAPPETEEWEAGVWEKIHDVEMDAAVSTRSASARTRALVGVSSLAGTLRRRDLDHGPASTRKRWLAAAAAAAVVFLGVGEIVRRDIARRETRPPEVVQIQSGQAPDAPLLALRVEPASRGPSRTRGENPAAGPGGTIFLQRGDELAFDATVGGAPYAEVRLYLDDRELQLRCPPGCQREGGHLRGRITLPVIGKYQLYVVISDNPLPAPEPTLAADTERLLRAGARIEVGRPVQAY